MFLPLDRIDGCGSRHTTVEVAVAWQGSTAGLIGIVPGGRAVGP